MMTENALARAVLITWRRNAEYGVRLAGDLGPEMFVVQPMAGRVMNHPAWVLSHLNLYAGIAVRMCRGEAIEDPAEHRYGQKSEPLGDAREYASAAEMVAEWRRVHEEGTLALQGASSALTGSENPLARWRGMHPTVGDMLVTLMVKHESAHLGQLSAWRRAMGLGRVAM